MRWLVSGVVGDLLFQLGGLGFGEETLFLETGFAAAFVAVPEDEEEDWQVRAVLVTRCKKYGVCVLDGKLTEEGKGPKHIHAHEGRKT